MFSWMRNICLAWNVLTVKPYGGHACNRGWIPWPDIRSGRGGGESVKVNSWQRCKAERSGEDVAVTVRWMREKKEGKIRAGEARKEEREEASADKPAHGLEET